MDKKIYKDDKKLLALALIVKPTDEESELLKNALSNAAPHVDAIFVTITGRNEKCEEVARLFGANISFYQWDYSFANARNFNFSQVPNNYKFICWMDCDDQFRGLFKLRPILEQHPDVDVFNLWYIYAYDENKDATVVHQKTMVVRNDGCVEWAGDLHEDFRANRELKAYFIEGIDRMHFSYPERFEQNKDRNIEVSKRSLEKNPNDPRSYWNYGNSLSAAGRFEESITALEKFLELSLSDDEKYIASLRIGEALLALKQYRKALDRACFAVGLIPHYPDAHYLKGQIYFSMNKFKEAGAQYLVGIKQKPKKYSIIVFNPRAYDYEPLMMLAKCYFNLSLPIQALECLRGCAKVKPNDKSLESLIKKMEDEAKTFEGAMKEVNKLSKIKDDKKLALALEKIPDEFKSAPIVCNLRNTRLVKKESSGKDIVFYCSFTEEIWTPETALTKGIGGSEEAVINLSNELADFGWNVTVYNNCGHKELKFRKVTYKPYWSWNYRDKQDVVVLWRHPKPADYEINAPKVFLDLHDVLPEGELTNERLKKIDKIFVKSQFHRSLYANVPDDKFVVVPNGLNTSLFQDGVTRDPYLIINTSSADRGLSASLDCFAEIKKQVPEAKFVWAYGWQVFDNAHADNMQVMEWKEELLTKVKNTPDFELAGRLSHVEVAKLYQRASILLYPSEFAEIDCISVRKAQLAVCTPVTTDFAALATTNEKGIKIHSEKTKDNWVAPYQFDFSVADPEMKKKFIDVCVNLLRKQIPVDEQSMKDWAKDFNWKNIATVWDNEINGKH